MAKQPRSRRRPSRTKNPPMLPADPRWGQSWQIRVDNSSTDVPVIEIHDANTAEQVGEVVLAKSNFGSKLWRVSNINVKPTYAGKGVGQALYLIAMKLYGRVHPDWEESVSPAALRAWKALKSSGLIVGSTHPAFRSAKAISVDNGRDFHVQFTQRFGGHSVLFPAGWRGVLDQVWRLRDPDLVSLKRRPA